MHWPKIPAVAWRGAALGVILVCLFILVAEIFDNLSGEGMWFYGSFTSILIILLIAFLTIFSVLVLRCLQRAPFYYQAALASALAVSYFAFPFVSLLAFLYAFICVVLCPSILGGSLALLLREPTMVYRRYFLGLFGVIVPGAILIFVGYWLMMAGTQGTTPPYFVNTQKTALDLPNPSLPGSYAVHTLAYGSGRDYYREHYGDKADLKTEPVDGSPFISGWSGWTGWIRTYFWGFDATELPLNACVWYPEGSGPFPLILLVHGNHTMSAFSDTGYTYLGNLLASQGFIFVSVDENFLNSNYFDRWSDLDEVPARGWLLLKHLSEWKKWNEIAESPFYRKVDMNNIGLIGHSRGGEAIVTAKALNDLPFFPDDGTIPLNFNFSIKALAAIAPKDGQYLPAGLATPLDNVNYFGMHGSQDSDVRSFEATKAYSRLTFDDQKYWFKSVLYILGANHGQFNDVWGRFDLNLPESLFLNIRPILSKADQQTIAEVYLSAFMRACLKNEKEYIPLFWDSRLGSAWLPNTHYLSQFADSNTTFIYADKKDLDISRATFPGVIITQKNLAVWQQMRIPMKKGDLLDSAILVGWKNKSSLTIKLPIPNVIPLTKESTLLFSLADANESLDKDNPLFELPDEPLNFTLELKDIYGQKASLLLSNDSFLYPQIQSQIYKADFFDQNENSELVFASFRFPLKEFLEANTLLDVTQLGSLRFVFDKTPRGVIAIDRIGFQNP